MEDLNVKHDHPSNPVHEGLLCSAQAQNHPHLQDLGVALPQG
jgi:hypothetical protein